MQDGGWTATRLDPGVSVRVGTGIPVLPQELGDAVAAVWNEERLRRPALFNGRVFCADTIAPDRIDGHWTEYRRVLTQMRRPELFDRLRIRALAVNGVLECRDGLLLGLRHPDAVYLPGRWQAAPAGNVESRTGSDAVDLGAQLLAELEEELGLTPAEVASSRPVAAIEHAGTRIVDVGFLLRTPLGCEAVTSRAAAGGNGEYDRFLAVGFDSVAETVERLGPTLLPSARILLRLWGSAR